VACKPKSQQEYKGNWIEDQMQFVATNGSCWSVEPVRNVFLMGACDLRTLQWASFLPSAALEALA